MGDVIGPRPFTQEELEQFLADFPLKWKGGVGYIERVTFPISEECKKNFVVGSECVLYGRKREGNPGD